ncbi:MAG: hypothetical protein ACRCZP_19205 [Phycicoccus sp.]
MSTPPEPDNSLLILLVSLALGALLVLMGVLQACQRVPVPVGDWDSGWTPVPVSGAYSPGNQVLWTG